jgi:hypothetical protein
MVSKRRNDDRPIGRRPPKRDPKFRILVVCEGKVTEPKYIRALQHDVHNPRVHVQLAEESGVPVTVVTMAAKLRDEADKTARRERDDNLRYDVVWAVFDVDDHPHLDDARRFADANNVLTAISNPCFELWALLHFADQRAHIERGALATALRKFLPGYEKDLAYEKLRPHYGAALIRARALADANAKDAVDGKNPSTGVFKLTEMIRNQ